MPGDKEFYPLSVVIPTLGDAILFETIENLNSGIVIPSEILVCIPEKYSYRVEGIAHPNIKILETPFHGQVSQRAYGLRHVKQPLVLQLDDDAILSPENLHKLVQSISLLGHGNAVGPLFGDTTTNQRIRVVRPGIFGWLKNLYESLVCGAPWGKKRMGVISPAGMGYGVDINYCEGSLFETQWLPGGCVLSYQEELVLEDYFPFPGKGYSEDLIHSILRGKKGIRHWVAPEVICMTKVSPAPFGWTSQMADFKARKYVVTLIGGKMWRLQAWYILHVLKNVLLIAPNKLKKLASQGRPPLK